MYPTVLVLATAFTRSYLERTINYDTMRTPQVIRVPSRINYEVDEGLNIYLSENIEDRDRSPERVILMLGENTQDKPMGLHATIEK